MCDIMSETIGDEFDEEILMLLLKKPSVLIDEFISNPNNYGSFDRAIVKVSSNQKYRTTTRIISEFKTIGVFETLNTIYISTRGSFYQRNVSKFA